MKKNCKRFPVVAVIIYGLTLLSVGLYIAFRLNASFADTFNATVSQFLRHVLAKCTSILPFSLAEWIILCFPILLIALIYGAIKYTKGSFKRMFSFLFRLFAAVGLVFCLFVWTFAPGYAATGIDEKLDLERKGVSETELLRATLTLTEEVNALSKEVFSLKNGSTYMPYSIAELNEKLLTAYEDFANDTEILTTYYSKVKPVFASKFLSYSHVTGIYAFPTGEANINVDFPDYTIPYTMAHELAHQRGIAREDEANFVAYLVCMKSDDVYIRYSATLSLWEYMMNAIYTTNQEVHSMFCKIISKTVQDEEAAYAKFYSQYADNALADVNDFVNDTYLKSQGAEEGNRSYNLVVDLAVAYFKSEGKIPVR